MLNQRRFIIGAVLIAAAVSYLVYAGIKTTSVYYFEMDEFVAHRDNHAGEDLRVRRRHSEPVPVAYTGILPDMFAEGREVVVEGRYEVPGLKAKQIMTSCPSKYEAEREQGATHPGA